MKIHPTPPARNGAEHSRLCTPKWAAVGAPSCGGISVARCKNLCRQRRKCRSHAVTCPMSTPDGNTVGCSTATRDTRRNYCRHHTAAATTTINQNQPHNHQTSVAYHGVTSWTMRRGKGNDNGPPPDRSPCLVAAPPRFSGMTLRCMTLA